ncbi:translation elongation factor Ts [Alkalilimnicola sp. S0819]|uniref:translation elongation factor Ts n=1 Tax=Alkalilimnicola sp. S0819 TaxID=2613922 RepID=UPI0012628D3D|nr:translation elongation factor Ts [Alkalilimnicola sp. S0819]KAB7627917.1 elongation factor Ts [Alkalilimnicola sp. S0819]MPQ15553.1 elongation factor Ts [Alkalilimnicola sp. S0819]
MAITAAQVKELRERTGAGMMECKKALVETDGDIEAAAEHMRKKGLAKADKKAGRVAAEGAIVAVVSDDAKSGALVEVNSETDFVSGSDDFQGFASAVAQRVLEDKPADVDALSALALDGDKDVNTVRTELVAKIGENIQIRRFARFETEAGQVSYYLHGARIGVMLELEGGHAGLARDIAMHIAATKPLCVSEDEVPAEERQKEKDILIAQAKDSGKPAEIVEKMVEGRIRKWLAEITLVGQPFVKDPDQTVGKLLKDAGAKVVRFVRLEVGEGIEKKQENFADEVMAQVRGS